MSAGVIGNDQFNNALAIQQVTSTLSTTTATLKRAPEDNINDSGIPAKRAVMQGIDGSLVQIGTPYMGGNDTITESYPVPENTVGLVIGKGGSEIQGIQNKSGCSVQMRPDSDNSGFRQVTLQGLRPNIEKAKALIDEVVSRAHQRQQQQVQMFNTDGNPRAITIDIHIPPNKCGLIIGKQGDTIRQLQEQSGCKMMMIQTSQEVTGMAKPLRVCGEPEKVEVAKRLVADLISKNEDGAIGGQMGGSGGNQRMPSNDNHAIAKGEVVVPRSSVGMIIGKGGDMIKRLATETGTKIQFKPDDDPNSPERCAVIMGTRDQIYRATELITDLVNRSNMPATQQETFYMHVPSIKTGLVIGKGGETIKQINQESGAHCELSRDPPPNSQEKVFVIKGTQQQIHHAQHIIRIKVGDIPPNTPVPMFGGSQIQGASGGFSQPAQPQFPAQQYTGQGMQQQWNGLGNGGIPAQSNPQDSNIWSQNQMFAASAQPAVAAMPNQFNGAQFQQTPAAGNPAVMQQPQFAQAQMGAQPQAQPAAQAAPSAGQPTINPSTGQPDYSAQWAEYYRSVGLLDQAAMVESQIKQNQAARAAGVSVAPVNGVGAGYSQYQVATSAAPNQTPATSAIQHIPQYQNIGGFPQTGQFQAGAHQTPQF